MSAPALTLAERRLVELAVRRLPRYRWARPVLDDYNRKHGPLPPLSPEELKRRAAFRSEVIAPR